MRAGHCLEVFDLYEWLPAYGESSVSFASEGLDIRVVIGFENEHSDLSYRAIRFKGVCAFYKALLPGPYLLNLHHSEGPSSLGALCEYLDSEAGRKWTDHLSRKAPVRHFRVNFLAENCMFEVFCEDVELERAQNQ
jgi:hypothetical protein